MPFNPQEHKSGKWLKFELGTEPQLVCVHQGAVRRGTLTEAEELALLLRKVQHSADGRMVGVFVKGGRLRAPGSKELIRDDGGEPVLDGAGDVQYKDTPERFHPIPDCIAPIRAIIGLDGSHNLSFAFDGQVHTLLLALDGLQNVDLITIREDIPSYRNETLAENFDPSETMLRTA